MVGVIGRPVGQSVDRAALGRVCPSHRHPSVDRRPSLIKYLYTEIVRNATASGCLVPSPPFARSLSDVVATLQCQYGDVRDAALKYLSVYRSTVLTMLRCVKRA